MLIRGVHERTKSLHPSLFNKIYFSYLFTSFFSRPLQNYCSLTLLLTVKTSLIYFLVDFNSMHFDASFIYLLDLVMHKANLGASYYACLQLEKTCRAYKCGLLVLYRRFLKSMIKVGLNK